MLKKSIIKGNKTEGHNMEEVIEVSSLMEDTIYIKLGVKKIFLSLDAAEELAHQLISDVEFIRSKIIRSKKL
ncbi:MAG: hypothetical protein ACI83H_000520 [Glaciecola sp.]|jgi:hypothetical protein